MANTGWQGTELENEDQTRLTGVELRILLGNRCSGDLSKEELIELLFVNT